MKRLLLIAAALVILANAAVFARVAYNRSGEPRTITLTERELVLPYYYSYERDENSGLRLEINWQVATKPDRYSRYNRDFEIGEQQFRQLGFHPKANCDDLSMDRGGRDLSRKGWVALEYDGRAHAEQLRLLRQQLEDARQEIGENPTADEQQKLKEQARRLEEAEQFETRLYAVDVAAAKKELIEKYRDSGRHIILAASIRNASECERLYKIYVSELLNEKINIPVQYHPLFAQVPARSYDDLRPPAYQASIAFGQLNEPWLLSVEKIE